MRALVFLLSLGTLSKDDNDRRETSVKNEFAFFQYIKFMFIPNELDMSVSVVIEIYWIIPCNVLKL